MNIKHDSVTGHLLHNAGGHLVHECGGGEPVVTVHESCDCCFSSNSRASWTMPALVRDGNEAGYNDNQLYTEDQFVAWFNANVTAILTSQFIAIPGWSKSFSGGTFDGRDSLTGVAITMTASGSVTANCIVLLGVRRWAVEVRFYAGYAGMPANSYSIECNLWWTDGTCCGAAGPMTLEDFGHAPAVAIASGASNAFAITGNYACRNGTACEVTTYDNCPDYAACNPLP